MRDGSTVRLTQNASPKSPTHASKRISGSFEPDHLVRARDDGDPDLFRECTGSSSPSHLEPGLLGDMPRHPARVEQLKSPMPRHYHPSDARAVTGHPEFVVSSQRVSDPPVLFGEWPCTST